MAHFHLAWELGGDAAHAGRLRVIAQALLARGHAVSLSVRDLGQARRLLGALDVTMLQAPLWLHGAGQHAASLAEVMLAAGYREAQTLDALVRGWRSALQLLKPDVVVAEFAPTALLAARTLDIPSAAIGAGFTLPPPGQPLPNFRPWEPMDLQRLAAAEVHTLKVMNTVLVHHGGVPYVRAADALLGRQHFLCAWPELDHYGRPPEREQWFGPAFVAPPGEAPQWPPGHGHKVFVYLRQEHPAHIAVLHALVMEGCRVLCYQPEVAAGAVPPVHASSLAYARGPVTWRRRWPSRASASARPAKAPSRTPCWPGCRCCCCRPSSNATCWRRAWNRREWQSMAAACRARWTGAAWCAAC